MAARIRTRAISSEDLMLAHIHRIEEVNPVLNAVVEPLFESALAAAREADQVLSRRGVSGPLHGIPVSVKDSIDVKGVRTTAGTIGRKNAKPATEDAVLVARFRAAGAIPIAKTNLPDLLFAYESDNLIFGRTNNPYDVSRTSGGSSGGESALLAAGGSALGLGSDAAGSLRLPAAFCGLSTDQADQRKAAPNRSRSAGRWLGGSAVADRSYGAACQRRGTGAGVVSCAGRPGFLEPAGSAGQGATDARCACRPVHGQRLRVTNAGSRRCRVRAAHALEQEGLDIERAVPPGVADAFDIEMDLLGADGCAGLHAYANVEGSFELHPILRDGFLSRMQQRKCSASEFGNLWARWDAYRLALARFFERYDVILCPVYTQPALPHGASVEEENFRGFSYTMAWNVGGVPAATVRCGEVNGLPVNVQVVTARWNDRLALNVCALLEQALGGFKPPNPKPAKPSLGRFPGAAAGIPPA